MADEDTSAGTGVGGPSEAESVTVGTGGPSGFGRLVGMLRPYRGPIFLGLVLLVMSAPCELFPALCWKFVADEVIEPNTQMPVLHWLISFGGAIQSKYVLLGSAVGWMLCVYAVGEVLQTVEQNILNRVAQRFILHLRNRVYAKLQGQSLGYLQRQRTGDLMSRALGDVDEVQNFIVSGIDVIIGEGFLWLVTLCVVFWLDWRVALAALSPLLCVYVLLRVFNTRIKPIYTAVRDRAGDVSTRLQENLLGIVVIKIFSREKQEAQRFEAATKGLYDQQIVAVNRRSLYFPFARGVGFLSNVFMLGVGGYFILQEGNGKVAGGMTVGTLLAFRAYWWRLFGPVQTLARVNDMVQRALAASRRVFEVLDAPDELPDAPGAITVERARGEIELRDVTFAYPTDVAADPVGSASADRLRGSSPENNRSAEADPTGRHGPVVLEKLNIRIEPGQTVALCGPSGSGKSTVLNLLVRFYDPIAGAVTLDGRDLRSIRRESLRRHFALVQQETFLFNDSILDNIRYGHSEATMEQVINAAKAANAHGFITQFAEGYATRVGERGVRLSGGQKQRISIARAFLANPAILLLDEPTSSVEPDSEAAIIAALDRLMAGRTTVLTSHRPSLIHQADVVYVLEGGRVAESGTPGTLAANGTWFARFIRSAEGVELSSGDV